MSFERRTITVTIEIGAGRQGAGTSNKIVLEDYRVECMIDAAAGYQMGTAHLRIYGLPLDTMNHLTTIGPISTELQANNLVTVEAGTEGQKLSLIYHGNIIEAFGQFQGSPDVALEILAQEGSADMLKPTTTTSYNGSTSASTIAHGLASDAGHSFQDHGVTAQLSNPYLSGTTGMKLRKLKDATGMNYALDRGTLHIWPKNGQRQAPIQTISPGDNMIGYAVFSSKGITVKTIFLPTLVAGMFVNIEKSIIGMVNGRWEVSKLTHTLSSHTPDGPWFSNLTLFRGANESASSS